MKPFWIAIVVLLSLVAAGCRTAPANKALERENRYLEDTINELEHVLDRTQDSLDKCRLNSAAAAGPETPARRNGTQRPAGSPDTSAPPAVRGPELSPFREPPHAPPGSGPAGLPTVEIPSQPLPPGQIPEQLKGTRPGEPLEPGKSIRPGDSKGAGRRRAPPGAREDGRVLAAGATAVPARADSAAVARITLNRTLTGGFDLGDPPGDDGLAVVVEPRDARGKLVPAAGPISVALVDPGLAQSAARVAQWDLTAGQVAALYRRIPEGEGFFLRLAWPSARPVHSRLHLFVRYTTRDGRQLEARRELDVALPGLLVAEPEAVTPAVAHEVADRPSAVSRPSPPAEDDPSKPTWRARPVRNEPSPQQVSEAASPARDNPDSSPSATAGAEPSGLRPAGARRARPVWSPERKHD